MKKVQIIVLLPLLSLFSPGFAQTRLVSPNEITGLYWSPGKDAKIEIYLKGQQYFGKFIWLASPRKDTKNPARTLQGREVLGLELLTKFSYQDGSYTGGEIYDPESGKIYSCKMSLVGGMLKVRGYIGISLFGRTEYFERIQ